MRTPLESARFCAELAEKAASEGDIAKSPNLFVRAAMDFLKIAVSEFEGLDQARGFLAQEKVPALIAEGAKGYEKFLSEIRSGRALRKDMTGEYVFIAASHLALLLGLDGPARTYSRLAVAPETIVGKLPYFWNGYAESYAALLDGKPVRVPGFKKLRGEEKYWIHYIELMALLSQGDPPGEKVEELRALFLKRQSDKRINDWEGLEGDGKRPVKWDFRLEALLCAKR